MSELRQSRIRRAAVLVLTLVTGCAASPHPVARRTVPDLRGALVEYAAASCLAFQPNEYLKDQGERWAGAIMQNARGPAGKWTSVANAVRAELSRSGVAQGQGSAPQAPIIPLPVMTCGRITDTPSVCRSIDIAAHALATDYAAGTDAR